MVSFRLAVLAVAAASILGASAQPHRRHKHEYRDTHVQIAAARIEKHVVCDQYGNTLAVSYTTVYPTAAPTSSRKHRKSRKTTTTSVVEYVPEPTVAPVEPAPSTEAAAPATTAPSTAPYSGGSDYNTGDLGKGLVYSPYHNDGNCKSKDTVASEMKSLFTTSAGYNWVRIYGSDCNQVYNVVAPAFDLGIKVMLGIYNVNEGFQSELDTMVKEFKQASQEKAGKVDWSIVALISVGNEYVNNNGGSKESVAHVMSYVKNAKDQLSAMGYTRTVATSDVWYHVRDNPELCGDGDVVPINMHPFFDQTCTAETSGEFLKSKLAEVQAKCGSNQKVLIVETGWPTAGNKYNNAQPGVTEQGTFLSQAASVLDTYVLLTAYNEGWKKENTAAHVEKFWGIYGNSPSN